LRAPQLFTLGWVCYLRSIGTAQLPSILRPSCPAAFSSYMVIAALADQLGAIVSPPRDSECGRRAVVVDPDGHRVELTESKQ